MKSVRLVLLGASLLEVTGAVSLGQEYLPDLPVEHPAIRYAERVVDDPVALFSRRLAAEEVVLEEEETSLGQLAALLNALDVPVDSQALAFAKTSFQAKMIGPDNPRAIYFNDEVAVAYVRGSDMIEIISNDPQVGPIFYTANIGKLREGGFERRQVCLECHLGPATSGVPGLFVGSVFPGPSGKPARIDAIITDHRTALEERWGGWYVNATRGQQRDRSNAVASSPAQPLLLDQDAGRNLTHLYGKFDPTGYLASVSDIVALMTFEHQTQMLNFFTRVNWEERIARHEGETTPYQLARLDADIDALVAYMLFADEVPFPEPLEGISSFTETFPKRGPRDSRGRSLRDFDLGTRLFRHPLSYMIYSRCFEGLSDPLKEEIYKRLFEVLDGRKADPNGRFAHLDESARRTILTILRETKPGLPDYLVATPAELAPARAKPR